MKRLLIAMACILLLGAAAESHEGMIALFTDMDRTDRDDVIELYVIQDIYLFYLRGNGPDQLGAYEFRFLVSSPDVLIMNPEWPPDVWAAGNVNEDVTAVGDGVNLCDEWGTGDAFYLGTIPVINYGDPDTFTISVVEPIGGPSSRLQICRCEYGFPTHPVIGDMFLFNGDYESPSVVNAEARSLHSIEVAFDRELCPASAHLLSNYCLFQQISPGSPLNVTGTIMSENGTSVLVMFDESLIWNQSYVIDAGGIKDVNGYTILHGAPGSEVTFVASENTATLLLGYDVVRTEESIEISWNLSDVDEGVVFHVLRSETPAPAFVELPVQGLTARGLHFTYEDRACEHGTTYRYRIEYSDGMDRRVLFETENITVPALRLTLGQNYPNPFNPATSIKYVTPVDGHARLDVYDVSGRHVRTLIDEFHTKGEHTVEWNGFDGNGNPVVSGVYFYNLLADKRILTRKMVLLR
jgi:hypothetical protein